MITTLIFILFAGLAVGCAVAMVAQRNPLYSAISLIGVFISLAALYVMLAAPFIAAVQVIFVIMLLNVEEEVRRRIRLPILIPSAILLAAVLIAQAAFVIYFVQTQTPVPAPQDPATSDVGLTGSIGRGLFTTYL